MTATADGAFLSASPAPSGSPASSAPFGLDALAYGVDALEAILVFHLGDAHVYAGWVKPACGLEAEGAAQALREAFRQSELSMRRLAPGPTAAWSVGPPPGWGMESKGPGAGHAPPMPSPFVTLEMPARVALMRRIRGYVVATLFDATLPIGMARLVAGRLASSLEPELPLSVERFSSLVPEPPSNLSTQPTRSPAAPAGALSGLEGASAPAAAAGAERSRPPPSVTELDHARHLLRHLDAHAPEPHAVRLRLSLRTGISPSALDRLEGLGASAVALLEAAVEEILGLDRGALRGLS